MSGYTIVETMIFLVISAGLFGTVMSAMSQQNQRNQFTQTVDSLQVRLQDTLNDVSTGYYPSAEDFNCTPTATGPSVLSGAAPEQGANLDCIFIGKALQFGTDVDNLAYNIYTIVGNRLVIDAASPNRGEDVRSITEAKPNLLGVNGDAGVVDRRLLEADVRITKIVMKDDGSNVGGIAILSDFSKKSSIDNAVSGNAARVNLAGIRTTNLTTSEAGFASAIYLDTNYFVTSKGVIICLQESGAGDGRKASITIGSEGQQLSLDREIDPQTGECS